ncbi:MAG: hypothetical protein ACYC6S_13245 [Desulfobulbia bacterium]
METPITLIGLIKQINIDCGFSYLLFAIALSFAIRLILCLFKAIAIIKGESDTEKEGKLKGKEYKTIFWQSFLSNSGDIRIDDHWLPLLLGVVELIVFPFFMAQGYWKAIIGWIGLKALSSWGGNNTRTAYNRFLFGNIITLAASAFIAMIFIN